MVRKATHSFGTLVTTSQAARTLALSEGRIRELADSGGLKHVRDSDNRRLADHSAAGDRGLVDVLVLQEPRDVAAEGRVPLRRRRHRILSLSPIDHPLVDGRIEYAPRRLYHEHGVAILALQRAGLLRAVGTCRSGGWLRR